ncbi:DUF2892 domain-containing protein [Pseudohongiella nitratireducens]|uniref:YgaP family membrane protein n=1 Tax=Pseudohongiella nitratireducens TaxID=1768907 RepID=UPI0030EB9804|tara:strand:+ start:774 stop:1094 length:321 start_codon:yes stop_codon:yes gene_type:complete
MLKRHGISIGIERTGQHFFLCLKAQGKLTHEDYQTITPLEYSIMKCNIGKIDRVIRIILGLGIISAGFYFQSWLGVIGLIPVAIAAMGWCPLYLPLGVSTCPGQKD